MKKKLSILVALAMAVTTMLPVGVFARTENSIDRIPVVTSDDYTLPDQVPMLTMELKDDLKTTSGVYAEFRVTSNNAEFVFNASGATDVVPATNTAGKFSEKFAMGRYFDAKTGVLQPAGALPTAANPLMDVRKITSKIIEVRIFSTAAGTLLNGNTTPATKVMIPMNLKAKTAGDITVAVDPLDTTLTGGTYTAAVAGTGSTKTTSTTTTDFSSYVNVNPILVDELRANFLTNGTTITLQAPTDFVWSTTTNTATNSANPVVVEGLGSLATYSASMLEATSSATPATGAGVWQTSTNDSATVTLYLPTLSSNRASRGSLLISNLKLTTKNGVAAYNDNVNVKISGITGVTGTNSGTSLTEDTFSVGKFVDYGVKLTGGDVTIVGATLENNAKSTLVDKNKTVKAIFEETLAGSWISTRKTTFTMPDGVKILGVKIKSSNVTGGPGTETTYNATTKDTWGFAGGQLSFDGNTMMLTGQIQTSYMVGTSNLSLSGSKAKLEMTFYVSSEADFVGPVNLTVAGGGIGSDVVAKVATVINPVTIKTTTKDLQIGYQNLEVNDISIMENVAGAIKRTVNANSTDMYGNTSTFGSGNGGRIKVWVGDSLTNTSRNSSGFAFEKGLTVSVADGGDLLIDSYKIEDGILIIDIKRESTKPSTILISGAKIRLDRTIPEGFYPLNVGGSAVVQNFQSGQTDTVGLFKGADSNRFQVTDYIKVVTPGSGKDGKSTKQVVITIGETSMTVGQDEMTMDVAPYIQDNRTMLPVKYVSNAIGISDQNIIWDANNKTVTVIYGSRTVQIAIGSKVLTVNGTPINMDTAAVIKDGRTFIPVAWLATALDVPFSWDGDAKTVTFNPADAQ